MNHLFVLIIAVIVSLFANFIASDSKFGMRYKKIELYKIDSHAEDQIEFAPEVIRNDMHLRWNFNFTLVQLDLNLKIQEMILCIGLISLNLFDFINPFLLLIGKCCLFFNLLFNFCLYLQYILKPNFLHELFLFFKFLGFELIQIESEFENMNIDSSQAN